ncbi:MAG: hypothetical protein BIFFINMI_03573 [Phycisphaerae bacterium]|nr:hypothetical protein [Phycisphaerae bacterium]
MFLRFTTTIATVEQCYARGQIYDLPIAIAKQYIRKGLAEVSDTPPEFLRQLEDKLNQGYGQRCLFLPHCGEFGHMILSHIRYVHFSKASYKIVCSRRGEEVLYPDADEFDFNWTDPIPDGKRAGSGERPEQGHLSWPAIIARHPDAVPIPAGGLTSRQEKVCICPEFRIPFKPRLRGMRADVLLGVRQRDFEKQRNIAPASWQAIADALTAEGLTFATVGAFPTSFHLRGELLHTDGDTDAAIELMQHARLWVSTDTGSAHLCAEVGACPMLVFRNDGQESFIDLMRNRCPYPLTFLPFINAPQKIIPTLIDKVCQIKQCE